MTEDEMVGWHHRLNGHESEQAPGDGEGQGSLVCCSPRGHKESDMTEQQQSFECPQHRAYLQRVARIFPFLPPSFPAPSLSPSLPSLLSVIDSTAHFPFI